MTTKTLSVYDALIEISRINDKISNVFNGFKDNNLFITYGIENSKTLCGIDRDKCLNVLKSNYDSINHLISNLYEYKAKVALSNATTKITIGNKEYTVAEAIQRKANIDNEVKFINRIESQLSRALSEITKHKMEICLKESRKKQILHSFEKNEFYIPQGWDDVLTSIYGDDYMTPPPEGKRISTHVEAYYWKADIND